MMNARKQSAPLISIPQASRELKRSRLKIMGMALLGELGYDVVADKPMILKKDVDRKRRELQREKATCVQGLR